MTTVPTATFRVDRFDVPRAALDPFMARLRTTQRLLDAREGCRQNLVLQGAADGGSVAVVTIVEWASEEAMAAARTAMQSQYAREGFDPAAFMRELGIRPDMATYRPI
jgi:heme-degrading monooxygenase HmoA